MSWHLEATDQFVLPAVCIEFTLDVVAVLGTEAGPRRACVGRAGGIKTVPQLDSDEVADQVAVVEVVSDEHFRGQAGISHGRAECFAEAPLEVRGIISSHRQPLLTSGAFVADAVDFD